MSHPRLLLPAWCLGVPLIGLAVVLGPSGRGAGPDFAGQVRPVLAQFCFECHGPDASTRATDLRLDLAESTRAVVQPDGEGRIVLRERLTSSDPDVRMPPPEAHRQPSPQQRRILLEWLANGAEYVGHWALEPVVRPPIPPAVTDPWCENPIDAFVLEAMRRRGLEPGQRAGPRVLLRRMVLDLTGLPPDERTGERFMALVARDGTGAACDWLLDRSMASPDYAEQMTLPWLEAARYADTDGYQNDRYRYQHAWRDWVIKAYAEKMPYDQFAIEQLAGDLLPDATLWQQVATGFCRNHRINSEDGSIPEEWLVENVADRVDTFGTVFLGLTIGCARCHDHKYDPISQREYYQLFAFFNNVAEHGVGPNNGNSPPFVALPESWPMLRPEENRRILPEPVKLSRARLAAGNGLMRPQAGSPQTVMVMHELERPRETYLLRRGRYNLPDKSERLWPNVPRALDWEMGGGPGPAAVSGSRTAAVATRPSAAGDCRPNDGPPTRFRNRLDLARWLVDPRHPLTARVAVNRVWQQFFGRGLVETSDNFGSQGTPPSHPELLDWLASELISHGWAIEHIQRLIVSSATYRQSSSASPEAMAGDPHNRWLARGPRRRLTAFELRDQALAVSGLLVEKVGGPSVKPYMPPKIWSSISNNKYRQDKGENLFRRSLYTYWRRTIPPPTMVNFNAAAREVCVVRNEITNTPLQALTLLNNRTFVEAARNLAQRMLTAGGESPVEQIEWGMRRVLARPPTPDERGVLLAAFEVFRAEYQADAAAAKQLLAIGESPRPSSLPLANHAAMTMTASLILNLDEAITTE